MQQLFQQLLQILTTSLLLYMLHRIKLLYRPLILLFMPNTKGKSNKPSNRELLNIKNRQINSYSSRLKPKLVQEGYLAKHMKRMGRTNIEQNKIKRQTKSKLPTEKTYNTKQATTKYGKLQKTKQKKSPSKPNNRHTKNIKHNPQQQYKPHNRQSKKQTFKQDEVQHPSQQQMIDLAKSILNKIKNLKPENQLGNQCKELDKKIEKEKNVSKQSSCRIFKLVDLALSMAKQERRNDQQQSLQRAYIRQQINPKLFQCKILYEYEDFRQYLLQIMSKQCGKVTKTELVYRYDIYNKVNIHQYIDNKPKLLFIVQTIQDFIIAAYTQAPFLVNTIPNAKSFLATLTNGRYYRKISDKKSLIYDPIYVVFGNSDLRIKGDQVFSNLGLNNSSYDSRGERCHALFGEGTKNTTVIKQMQVFQVTF